MPGSLAEELKRILALQKAKGTRYVWLSPQNAQAFFFSMPQISAQQPIQPQANTRMQAAPWPAQQGSNLRQTD